MAWTLEYNGVTKTFPAWGFTDPMFYPASLDVSRFTVRQPGIDVTSPAVRYGKATPCFTTPIRRTAPHRMPL